LGVVDNPVEKSITGKKTKKTLRARNVPIGRCRDPLGGEKKITKKRKLEKKKTKKNPRTSKKWDLSLGRRGAVWGNRNKKDRNRERQKK